MTEQDSPTITENPYLKVSLWEGRAENLPYNIPAPAEASAGVSSPRLPKGSQEMLAIEPREMALHSLNPGLEVSAETRMAQKQQFQQENDVGYSLEKDQVLTIGEV